MIMAGENTGLLAAALARLTAALDDGAVLFHCTAGKDRTGVLAAAVLWLCGAAREDIVADYEVSHTYNQGGLGALADKMAGCDQLLPLLRSEPENMVRLVDFFRESGLDGRLVESGFSAEEQRRLREKMIQRG